MNKKSSEKKEIKDNENNKSSLSESQKQWASLFSQIREYRPDASFQQRFLNRYPININGMSEAFIGNAIMMNERLKRLNTYPSKYDKTKIEEMVANPQNYEFDLRALSRYTYNTLTPIYKQVNLYADILTYRTYVNITDIKSQSKLIKEYNRIIIHRHVRPDGDCIGTQHALKKAIQYNFPEKEVYAVGDIIPDYLEDYGVIDDVTEDMYNGSLVIVVDTANESRICGEIIYS